MVPSFASFWGFLLLSASLERGMLVKMSGRPNSKQLGRLLYRFCLESQLVALRREVISGGRAGSQSAALLASLLLCWGGYLTHVNTGVESLEIHYSSPLSELLIFSCTLVLTLKEVFGFHYLFFLLAQSTERVQKGSSKMFQWRHLWAKCLVSLGYTTLIKKKSTGFIIL